MADFILQQGELQKTCIVKKVQGIGFALYIEGAEKNGPLWTADSLKELEARYTKAGWERIEIEKSKKRKK